MAIASLIWQDQFRRHRREPWQGEANEMLSQGQVVRHEWARGEGYWRWSAGQLRRESQEELRRDL